MIYKNMFFPDYIVLLLAAILQPTTLLIPVHSCCYHNLHKMAVDDLNLRIEFAQQFILPASG